jgi:hypothetical protein
VEIQYPEYFRVKATTVIPYACGIFLHSLRNINNVVDVWGDLIYCIKSGRRLTSR